MPSRPREHGHAPAGRADRLPTRFGARRVFPTSGLPLTLLGPIPAFPSFTGRLSPQGLLGWYPATGWWSDSPAGPGASSVPSSSRGFRAADRGNGHGLVTVIAAVGLVLRAPTTVRIDVPAVLLGATCGLLLIIGTARSTRAAILVAAMQERSPPAHRAAQPTLFRLPPLVVVPASHVLLGLLVDATTPAVAFAACGLLSPVAVAIGWRLHAAADIDAVFGSPGSGHG